MNSNVWKKIGLIGIFLSVTLASIYSIFGQATNFKIYDTITIDTQRATDTLRSHRASDSLRTLIDTVESLRTVDTLRHHVSSDSLRTIIDTTESLRTVDTLRHHVSSDSLRSLIGATYDTLDTVKVARQTRGTKVVVSDSIYTTGSVYTSKSNSPTTMFSKLYYGELYFYYNADTTKAISDAGTDTLYLNSNGNVGNIKTTGRVKSSYITVDTLNIDGWEEVDYIIIDTLSFGGQIRTDWPDSGVYATNARHADSADYAPVIGGAGGSFYSVHVVDSLYTATDTVGADTLTDTVCTGGGLWAWTTGSSVPLQTNTGTWDTLTAQLSNAAFDSLATCGDSMATFDSAGAIGCTNGGAFEPNIAVHQNDTFFVYQPLTPLSDCSRVDSVAIYSYYDGVLQWWWKPVCTTSASSWQIIGADCHVAYDSVYAIVASDTILVAADSVRY